MDEAEARKSHHRFASGRDYHRPLLDRYLPTGVIGDIGCGTGRIAAHYETGSRRFISIDNDPEVVRVVSSLLPASDVRCGDAYALPLPDASLDAYIGLGVFELDGRGGERAATEAARVLRPGGLLYITVPYRNLLRRFGRRARWRGIDLPSFSATDIRRLLSRHGFDVAATRPSSIAHGLGPLRRLASLFPHTLDRETGPGYRLVGPLLRPFANSLLVVAYRH